MATDIVTDQSPEPASEGAGVPLIQLPRYAPEDHEKAASPLKVVRLVELGDGAHGKTATFEFTGGFVRDLDVDAQTVWHTVLRPIVGADWHRLLKHVAPSSCNADGTIRTQRGPMWFWTESTTPRGRYLADNYFDVPEEDYAHGCLTGAKVARELIMFLKQYERARQVGPFDGIESMIERSLQSAFVLAQSRRYDDVPCAGAAAHVFAQTVTRFFMVGSEYANPAYLNGEVERAEASVAWSLDYDERKRKETAERMRAVRAAKFAKRSRALTTPLEIGSGRQRATRLERSEGAASSGRTLQ